MTKAQQAVEKLIQDAADMFLVTPDEVRGRSRSKTAVRARQWAMAEARSRYGWSYPELGILFGRDHTTVLHACRAVQAHRELLERMSRRSA